MPPPNDGLDEQLLAGRRILVVEDEERLRTIVTMMIEELSAEVVAVGDGLSALEIYRGASPRIDLVLLDMRMSGMNGITTFEELLKIDPEVKVVFSSGVAPENDVAEVIREHHASFIEKPFNLERLAGVLGRVLSGETTISPP